MCWRINSFRPGLSLGLVFTVVIMWLEVAQSVDFYRERESIDIDSLQPVEQLEEYDVLTALLTERVIPKMKSDRLVLSRLVVDGPHRAPFDPLRYFDKIDSGMAIEAIEDLVAKSSARWRWLARFALPIPYRWNDYEAPFTEKLMNVWAFTRVGFDSSKQNAIVHALRKSYERNRFRSSAWISYHLENSETGWQVKKVTGGVTNRIMW